MVEDRLKPGRGAHRPWRGRAGPVTALVAVIGVVVAVGTWATLATARERSTHAAMDRRTALVVEAVAAATARYVDTVSTVAAGAGAVETLTAARFTRMTEHLMGLRLPGATSIAFMVPATDEQIPAVQEVWRGRGDPNLVLAARGTGHEHIFAVLGVALDGTTAPGTGIDATGSPAAAQALYEARRSDTVTVSDAYHLLRDQHLPPERRQMSFVMTAPVRGPPAADGTRPFLGWVLMGLRGQDLVAAALSGAGQGLVDVTLSAPASDRTPATVAVLRADGPGRRDLARRVQLTVADRRWEVRVSAVGARLPGTVAPALPPGIGAGVLLLTGLLAALVHVLATRGARAQALLLAGTRELRRAEAQARDQAGLLSTVVNSLGEGVGVVDSRGDFLIHNPAARAMLGVEDVSGVENWQGHYGIFDLDGVTPVATERLPIVRALRGEAVDQVRLLIRNAARPDGIVVSVSARPLELTSGRGAVAVFRDITDRARVEASHAEAAAGLARELAQRQAVEADLAAQKDYLTQILDAIDVTVITCATDGTIVHANRAARAALPAEPVETVADAVPRVSMSRPDGVPIPPDETPLARALRGEVVTGAEAVVTVPTGGRRHVMLHARPLYDADGVITGAVGSSYNVTALREREAELSAFSAVVAHDLRSPLTTVRGFTELVRNGLAATGGPDIADHVADLDRVLESTARMSELISDLLTYSAAGDQPLASEDLDLSGLVGEVVAARTTAASVDPDLQVPQIYVAPLPPVHGDRALLRQVFDNLIGNAIKYTPPGRPAHVDVTAHPADGLVCVEVADRGIGIPAGQHHAIFGSFHRAHATAYPGTGLGLAICQRIVTRHGGTVTAHDNPGGGTVIRLTLPAAGAAAPVQALAVARASGG